MKARQLTLKSPAGYRKLTGGRAALVAAGCAIWTGLLGCTGADVVVDRPLPIPLVEKLPLTMGLYLSPELTGYVHTETMDERSEWRLNVGTMQQSMFENLSQGMFDQTVVLPEPTTNAAVDAVLVPSIEELQIAIPQQTHSTFYEVWIRYQIKLTEPDGDVLGEWPLTAYGNANARDYGMMTAEREPALHQAAYAALRDAMAFFTLQFRTIPAVETWLAGRLGGAAAGGSGAGPEGGIQR